MGDIIDLSSEKAKRTARQASADKAASQIALLFHDADRIAWANVVIDGHRETLKIESDEMRHYFRREAWRAGEELFGVGLTLSKSMVAERIGQLKAQAHYTGPKHQVFLRVAEDANAIYVDMCDRWWRAIRIGRFGWEIVDTPSIFFRRAGSMSPNRSSMAAAIRMVMARSFGPGWLQQPETSVLCYHHPEFSESPIKIWSTRFCATVRLRS
jgi:hypothetical protein